MEFRITGGFSSAVHQVLLRKGNQLTGLAEMRPLEGARHGEGPAAATVTLVLDGRHGAFVAPVDRVRDRRVRIGDDANALSLASRAWPEAVEALQLPSRLKNTVIAFHDLFGNNTL